MKDGLQVLSSTSAKATPLLFYKQKAWGFSHMMSFDQGQNNHCVEIHRSQRI